VQLAVDPPIQLLWILAGVPVFLALVMLGVGFIKPVPWAQRVVPVVLACVVSATIYHFAWKPLRFGCDEAGIHDDTFGKEELIRWSDVQEARLVHRYWEGELALKRRTSGTSYEGVRAGWFELANGTNAKVFLMLGATDDALLLRTPAGTRLYSTRGMAAVVETAKRHVAITE
jgi:hypothetical protein